MSAGQAHVRGNVGVRLGGKYDFLDTPKRVVPLPEGADIQGDSFFRHIPDKLTDLSAKFPLPRLEVGRDTTEG